VVAFLILLCGLYLNLFALYDRGDKFSVATATIYKKVSKIIKPLK
jgi:hypothetical protein